MLVRDITKISDVNLGNFDNFTFVRQLLFASSSIKTYGAVQNVRMRTVPV